MTEPIILCTDDVLFLPVVTGARENPAFEVYEHADAYHSLDECRGLVTQTLEHLGAIVPVAVSWSHGYQKHGIMRERRQLQVDPQAGSLGWKSTYEIQLSKSVFQKCDVAHRVQTVIHEACHVADAVLHPRRLTRDPDRGHGPQWQALMTRCGVPADVVARTDSMAMPQAVCPQCSTSHALTPTLAAQVRRGAQMLCRQCGTTLTHEHVHVPESMRAEVERSATRQKSAPWSHPCGAGGLLSPKEKQALLSGRARITCTRCKQPVTTENLAPGAERPRANPVHGWVFVGSCTDGLGHGPLIDWLVRHGHAIAADTFFRYVSLRDVEDMLGYTGTGLRIKRDWAVAYYKVVLPSGMPGMFLQWSHIEHLFVPPDRAHAFDVVQEERLAEGAA